MIINSPTLTVPRRFRLGSLEAFLPAFVVAFFASRGAETPKRRLHPTSYLDGLRGLASLAVFGYHYTDYNHKYFLLGWGVEENGGSSSVLQLPYVRLVYGGRVMVHVFFIISGFALSLRPMQELHNRRPDAAREALASACIRRPLRLLGPCMVLTFMLVFWCRAGFFHHYITPKETLSLQIVDWAEDFVGKIAWPWDWEHHARPRYNVHLWTIAVELSHSYLLFLFVLLLSPLRSSWRPVVTLLAMAYSLRCGRWGVFEFLGGCLLADLHLREKSQDSCTTTNSTQNTHEFAPRELLGRGVDALGKSGRRILGIAEQCALLVVLLAAGWVMSWPHHEPWPASYQSLTHYTPAPFDKEKGEKHVDFWFALAAFATVFAAGRVPWLRLLLETRFAQFTGRVSFSFYILQHPILNLLQPLVMGAGPQAATDEQPAVPGWGLRGWPGVETWGQRLAAWIMGWTVLVLVMFSAARIYTRLVDLPFVRMARWLERKICVERDGNRRLDGKDASKPSGLPV